MISFKHKFIYIHIPKTGGTSITNILKDYSEDYFESAEIKDRYVVSTDTKHGFNLKNSSFKEYMWGDYYTHASLEDIYQVLGDEIFSFYIFASIRNTFDRIISQTAYVRGLNTIPLRLENFSLPRPQLEYLKLDGNVMVDNFIRFENLQSDFDKICSDIGISAHQLGHLRKSSRDSNDYRPYYTDSSKKMIERMYQDEINFFNYKF